MDLLFEFVNWAISEQRDTSKADKISNLGKMRIRTRCHQCHPKEVLTSTVPKKSIKGGIIAFREVSARKSFIGSREDALALVSCLVVHKCNSCFVLHVSVKHMDPRWRGRHRGRFECSKDGQD